MPTEEDREETAGAWAAALPREPWNWVCFEPHPTLIGASDGGNLVQGLIDNAMCFTFAEVFCVQGRLVKNIKS
jgi:hypothetical protein